jgi:hypothetical protein
LIENVGTKVLGKRELTDDDDIVIDGDFEFPCGIFNRLRPDEWFDAWTLLAVMKLSDKPSFVRYGYSVPLDSFKRDRNGKMKRDPRPLSGWRGKVERFRSEARNQLGERIRLVFLVPLQRNNDHFTLLEINEIEEKIYHYDSMASENIISGTVELSRVGKIVQVS